MTKIIFWCKKIWKSWLFLTDTYFPDLSWLLSKLLCSYFGTPKSWLFLTVWNLPLSKSVTGFFNKQIFLNSIQKLCNSQTVSQQGVLNKVNSYKFYLELIIRHLASRVSIRLRTGRFSSLPHLAWEEWIECSDRHSWVFSPNSLLENNLMIIILNKHKLPSKKN